MSELPFPEKLRCLPYLETIWRFLRDHGCRVYLVGGILRDIILERLEPRCGFDIDLAVTGDLLAVSSRLARTIKAGYVLLDDVHLTVRLLKETDQGPLCIDISQLRAESIEKDLKLRDFTVNALAVDLDHVFGAPAGIKGPGQVPLIDTTGGLGDLKVRRLRHAAERAFRDDPLRVLRGFRLAAELDFEFSPATVELAVSSAHLLKNVSRERIRDELVKTLTCSKSSARLKMALEAGALTAALPGFDRDSIESWIDLIETGELQRVSECFMKESVALGLRSYLEVCQVTGRVRTALFKLALLIGFTPSGKKTTPRLAGDLLALARREIKVVSRIINGACFLLPGDGGYGLLEEKNLKELLDHQTDVPPGHPVRRAVFRFYQLAADDVPGAVLAAMAVKRLNRGAIPPSGERFGEPVGVLLTDYWRSGNRLATPPLFLNGADLISSLKVPEGPRVGTVLAALKEASAVGVVDSREEAREWVQDYLNKM